MSDSLPTGDALDAKARLLLQTTRTLTLASGVEVTVRKLKAGALMRVYEATEGTDGSAAEVAGMRLMVAHGLAEPTLTLDEVDDLDMDDLTEIAAAVLELSGLDAAADGEAASAIAQRGFPAGGDVADVVDGGPDDPHRS